MGGVGIVGTGISGTQLALYLQSRGVEATLYSPMSIEEHRGGRLPNCVMRWIPTVERERELEAFHWEGNDVEAVHVRVAGEQPIAFAGRLPGPANTTDFRLYLPPLMSDFADRGGDVVVGSLGPHDLPSLAARHDLIVVAAGRDGFGGVFPRDGSRSPYEAPARYITAGLYNGVGWPSPSGVEFCISPGVGEIFQVCFHSLDGRVSAIAVEAIPGGPLAGFVDLDYAADPKAFETTLLRHLDDYAPSIRERVDDRSFGLTRPVDILQGRLTPVVRKSWVPIVDGKYAIAIGDAWILNDPIAAQGANLGSRCAFLLGELVAEGGPFGADFCMRAEQVLWGAAQAPTILSNAFLEPPAEHVIGVLVRAATDQETADRFAGGFGDPEGFLAMLTPEPAVS